jgi:hypothetical protein
MQRQVIVKINNRRLEVVTSMLGEAVLLSGVAVYPIITSIILTCYMVHCTYTLRPGMEQREKTTQHILSYHPSTRQRFKSATCFNSSNEISSFSSKSTFCTEPTIYVHTHTCTLTGERHIINIRL